MRVGTEPTHACERQELWKLEQTDEGRAALRDVDRVIVATPSLMRSDVRTRGIPETYA
jgi:hypothetical protein